MEENTESVGISNELTEVEEKYNALINSINESYFIIDIIFNSTGKPVDCRFLETNLWFMEQVGITDIIGQTTSEVFPDREPYLINFYGQVAVSGIPAHMEYEDKKLRKWYDISAYKIGGTESRKVGVLFRDITERKRAEEKLLEAMQKAVALVAELEEADKNKNRFISVLSHELRNPLAVISAGLSLLEISSKEEQISTAKDIMKNQINQLCKLVDDLLDLTRISQNKIKLIPAEVNLSELIRSEVRDMRPRYNKKNVLLHVKLPKEPVIFNADPVRIAQCAGNLLENALKYTQAAGHVTISLATEDGEAVIRVKDNGIGMDPEFLEHIFTPFAQADTSIERPNGGGLGLGLSIIDGIVRLHGGTVTAFSEGIGEGSLFTIRLPPSIQIDGIKNGTYENQVGSTYKILFIEENKSFMDALIPMHNLMGS